MNSYDNLIYNPISLSSSTFNTSRSYPLIYPLRLFIFLLLTTYLRFPVVLAYIRPTSSLILLLNVTLCIGNCLLSWSLTVRRICMYIKCVYCICTFIEYEQMMTTNGSEHAIVPNWNMTIPAQPPWWGLSDLQGSTSDLNWRAYYLLALPTWKLDPA